MSLELLPHINKCQAFLIALRIKPPSLSCKSLCDLAPAYLSTPLPSQTPLQTISLLPSPKQRLLPARDPSPAVPAPRDSPSPLFTGTSLLAQLVKNPPAMQETRFDSWVGHNWATEHTAHNTYSSFKSQLVVPREAFPECSVQTQPPLSWSPAALPFPSESLSPLKIVHLVMWFLIQCPVSSYRWRTECVSPFLSVSPWGQSQRLGQTGQSGNLWRLTEWMTESCVECRWAHSVPLTDLCSLSPPPPQPGGLTRAELSAVGTVSSSSQVPSPVGLAGCKAPEAKGRPCHPWEQEPPVGSGQSRWEQGPWVLIRLESSLSFLSTAESQCQWSLACFVVGAARQPACFCLFTSPGPFHNIL